MINVSRLTSMRAMQSFIERDETYVYNRYNYQLKEAFMGKMVGEIHKEWLIKGLIIQRGN